MTAYTVQISTVNGFGSGTYTSSVTYALSVTTGGLSANSDYYFRVKAANFRGFETGFVDIGSTRTRAAGDVLAPANVSDLTALTGALDGQVRLAWTSPGNDSMGNILNGSYRIHASTTPYFYFSSTMSPTQFGSFDSEIEFTTAGVTPGTQVGAILNGLNPGTTYYISMALKDDNDNWNFWTRNGLFNTVSSAPAADLGVECALVFECSKYQHQSGSGAVVCFPPSGYDDRSLYRLYAATYSFALDSDAAVVLSSQVSHPLTQATTGALQPNTTYFFRASSLDSGDLSNGYYSLQLVSSLSSLISTVTLASAPGTISAASVNLTSITFSWQSGGNPNGTQYVAETSTDTGFGVYTSSTIYQTSVTTEGLTSGTSYYVRVKAVNFNGLETTYNTAIATASLPAAPSLNTPNFAVGDVGVSSVTARWNANGNGGDIIYRVQFATSADFTSSGVTLTSLTTTALYVSSAVSSNWTVAFRVRGENANGLASSYSASAATNTLPAGPSLNTPNFAASDVGTSSVTVRWNANGNADGTTYRVQFATSTDFSSGGVTLVEITTTALVISSSVPSNWTVAFRVRAEGSILSSYAVSAATVTFPVAPGLATPNFGAGDVGSSSATARWTANGNAGGTTYRVQFATSADFSSSGVTLTETTTVSLAVSSVTLSNWTLAFRVRAENANGTPSSYAASAATATLPSAPGLNTPNFSVSDVGMSSVTARWTANGNTGSTVYRVQFATSADFTSSGLTLTDATTTLLYISSATPSNWTIAFRVKAESVNNTSSSYTASVYVHNSCTPTLVSFAFATSFLRLERKRQSGGHSGFGHYRLV